MERKTASQYQQQPKRKSAHEVPLEAQSDPDKILRKPKRKRTAVPMVSDSENVLALKDAGPPAPTRESLSDSITSDRATDSEDSLYSVEEDRLESWYTNVGYLPVLDEPTLDVLGQVLSPFTMSSIKKKLYRTKENQTLGLNDRNVQIDPCLPTDPFLTEFHDIGPLQESGSGVHMLDLHDEVKKHHVDEWRLDLEKAIKDDLEATFRRTVMMSMLDRYRLMYNLKDGNQSILDFAVESIWNCPFMPTRALKKDKPDRQRMLSRPKPDISVAFRLQSIIENGLVQVIPDATRRIMTYEAQDGTRAQRAFHFLMFEDENAEKTSSDEDGQLKNLNSASQSLHCLYEFFNEADRQEVKCDKPCCTPSAVAITTSNRKSSLAGHDTFVGRFFKEVRVFTAVLTGTAITIRVHRACPASRLPFPSHEGRPPFQPLILPDYPLQFEYNELVRLSGDNFSRGLRPLLQEAAAAIATEVLQVGGGEREAVRARHAALLARPDGSSAQHTYVHGGQPNYPMLIGIDRVR
ncbi:hypothetical protein NUW58_g5895 [Xylaria curta]|uniref:Uncharacterized protein n=1 Tax=Xylaria curta TaxID=42375 RepID=A0ACC1P1X3_9PEZI|nr:hypothetical protein NUW58_g5895 [Xylaria curta]